MIYATGCDNGFHGLHEDIDFQSFQHQVKIQGIDFLGILRWSKYGRKPSIDGHILSEFPRRKVRVAK